MNIESLRIRNFRSYRDSGEVKLQDKLILVGENNAGKSNILRALNMFLDISRREPHDHEDYHMKDTEKDIRIKIAFNQLSEEEKDIFSEYMIEEKLVLEYVYPYDQMKEKTQKKKLIAKKKSPKNEDFKNPNGKSAEELKGIYEKHEGILRQYRPEDWEGKHGKYIEPTIENYVSSDQCKKHIEAVKNPSIAKKDLKKHLPDFEYFQSDRNIEEETKSSTNALMGKLLNHVISEVSEEQKNEIRGSLDSVKEKLNEENKFDEIEQLENRLRNRLNSHLPIDDLNLNIDVPDLESILGNVSVSVDDGVETDIEAMGSGMHTSFILACLRELKDTENEDQVIFGLEEPENDLHPHVQRQLFDTLREMSEEGNHQTVVSTHSAFMLTSEDLFDIARIEKRNNSSQVRTADASEFTQNEREKLKQKLDVEKNEMFFARSVMLCEGKSEARTLPILNRIVDEKEDEIIAFDRLGISLVELNGKSEFKNFLKLTNMFDIASVVVIDDDGFKDDGHKNLVDEIEDQAGEVIELPRDFEQEFFRFISIEAFCKAMNGVKNYSHNPEDLRKKQAEKNLEKEDLLREEFERENPSKPEFGRFLAKNLEDDIPTTLKEAMYACKKKC